VYTDGATAYHGMPFEHESVRHSVGEYVREMAHTNGIVPFWPTLNRAHNGPFHQLSAKQLQRYVHELADRHNIRDQGTWDQMTAIVANMIGGRLLYHGLVSNGNSWRVPDFGQGGAHGETWLNWMARPVPEDTTGQEKTAVRVADLYALVIGERAQKDSSLG